MAMADAEILEAPKGSSVLAQIAMLAGLTVVALGIGWGAGFYLKSQQEAAPKPAQAAASEPARPDAGLRLVTQDMPPITTNMAAPTETWVRMDISLLVEAPLSTELASAVHQDILAFIRTVKMHQVEGPSGFQHLKADLRERASMRSDGKVRDILIRTLVYE